MRGRRGLALAAAVLVAAGGFLGAGQPLGPLGASIAQAQSLPWPFNAPAKPRPKKRVPNAPQKQGATPAPQPAPAGIAQGMPLPLPRPRALGAAAGVAAADAAKAAIGAPTPIAPAPVAPTPAPRPDAPDAGKAQAPTPKDGQTDAAKGDAAKPDASKADPAKPDPGKPDAGKTETAKADGGAPPAEAAPAAPLPPARPPRDLVAEAPAQPPMMEEAYATCLAEFAKRGGEVERQADMPPPAAETVIAPTAEGSAAQHVFPKETDRSSPSATAANIAKETAADFAPPPEPTSHPEQKPAEKPADRIVASLQAKGQPAACAIPGPLTFQKINVSEAPAVTLEGAVTVRCTMALELAGWIREDLSAIAKRHGTTLAKVTGVGGHACRPRNNRPGGQVSEHASGNAFDLLGLKFTDGRLIELWKDDAATKDIREEVKKSACARFHTVLGPGADSAHANHVHVDLRERRNDFRMCQWEVK